jgi:ABC-type Fe3+ transport system permease subunit
MSFRAILARLILVVLCLLQLAALVGFFTLLLTQPGAPKLPDLVDALSAGRLPMAVVAAVATAVLAGPIAAMALWRLRLAGIATGLLLAPLLLPLALPSFGDGRIGLAVVLLSHASLGLALGTLCGMASLFWLDPGVLRAAAHSGLSPWGALVRVVLPVMAPGILASILLSAIVPLLLAMARLSFGLGDMALSVPPQMRLTLLAASGMALLLAAVASASVVLLRRP